MSGKNCLAAIFASRHQDASPGPLGLQRNLAKFRGNLGGISSYLQIQSKQGVARIPGTVRSIMYERIRNSTKVIRANFALQTCHPKSIGFPFYEVRPAFASLLNWAIPPVRLVLSGRNSGKTPERPRKRSQSVSWNSRREYGWDAPNPIIQGI